MKHDPHHARRSEAFRRNPNLEQLLDRLNTALSRAEREVLATVEESSSAHPLVFVMGPLRSGTTLFMQLLASTGVVAYPTNLLSRFYGAPLIGAQIQLLLTDPVYRFRNEIYEFGADITFDSENGKTQGALAPNEFWYFWRRFLPFGELDWLPDTELQRVVETRLLKDELVGLTRVLGMPFALKGMILNYNVPFLYTLFDNALFVQLKREPISNVASILAARRRQMGSEEAWYSFKIREYEQLKGMTAIRQSAGQLHYINKALIEGLKTVPESRKLVVRYEELCQSPSEVLESLLRRLGIDSWTYRGPKKFTVSREVTGRERDSIVRAIAEFEDDVA